MMDLHIHSTYSDGKLTPKEIIGEAFNRGITIISITDHDAIGGYNEGKEYADEVGIELIPGIELNTDGPDGELHILGYNFDPSCAQLVNHMDWRKQERLRWGRKIVSRLNELGYAIDFQSCLNRVADGILVRTHIAEELAEQGYFQSPTEGFQTLLKKGEPAFIEREEFTAENAINLIHQAGGLAFLAHPAIYDTPVGLKRLIEYGLDGIEVYHSKHDEETTAYWKQQAKRYNLLVSGGSDYHGPYSRNPFPIGSVSLGEEVLNSWRRR